MPTNVAFSIVNHTQTQNSSTGLSNEQIFLFLTQEHINTAWEIDSRTGVATPLSQQGVLPSASFTLANLVAAGGSILIDASLTIPSARIYLASSPNAVTAPNGNISGPTASTARFYYDFVEFALQGGNLNIDTTQVDQLGIPITLQVTPPDQNFSEGSGLIASLDRQTLFQRFAQFVAAPFQDCIFAAGEAVPLRLLNPADVIVQQLNVMALNGTIRVWGESGNWNATITIDGPGKPPPTNGSLGAGMSVSGGLIPAGCVIASLDGSQGVVIHSNSTENPFTATSTSVDLFFFHYPSTKLATYFDTAIDALFAFCAGNPILVEQNNGKDTIYTGRLATEQQPDVNGNLSTYSVIQFVGGNNETYSVYYPFFTTNCNAATQAGKQTPAGTPVPPPPKWWAAARGLEFYAPPSLMVFGASGVFADNTQQPAGNATILGAIENVVATALARGAATSMHFLNGTIAAQNPPATTAVVHVADETPASLTAGKYQAACFQIAGTPMTAEVGAPPVHQLTVSAPVPIKPTVQDLITLSQFYPAGAASSDFANFFHQPSVMIGGRAYALPFDDQGGYSSDLNSISASAVTITLGPWSGP